MGNHIISGMGPFRMHSGKNVIWDMTELLDGFKQLVLELEESIKMFLLIDGLDDFHGNQPE